MDDDGAGRPRSGVDHLRAQVVAVGLLASSVATAACAVYLRATSHGPHRGWLWALLLTSIVITSAMVVLGRRRFLRRLGVRVLHAWCGAQTLIIAASAALDGGPRSPYVGLLFLPMVAGAIGFPPRSVAKHGVWTTVCLLGGAGAAGKLDLPMALVWTAAIGLTSAVASSTARSLLVLSEDLDRANQRLARLARVDALTGCLNHRAFHERLQLELARRQRGGQPVSLLVLDIDHFKRVNDLHGHPVGDDVLREVGAAMRAVVRPGDVVGRTGGEEFAVMLPDTRRADGVRIGQRLRSAIAAVHAPVPVTVSVGLAVAAPGATPSQLMRTADDALYEAKRGGRDRLVAAGDGGRASGRLAGYASER